MITPENQGIFIDDLARRWRLDIDRIVELAGSGALPLWIRLCDVSVERRSNKTVSSASTQKSPKRARLQQIEVQPAPEILAQILGRCDRMLITAELPGLDAQGTLVTITNTVGEEWGEISMIGLKPTRLFARLNDVVAFEQNNRIIPATVQVEHRASTGIFSTDASPASREISSDLSMPPELQAAIACWQALAAQEKPAAVAMRKAAIQAWLHQHHPGLTKTAIQRITLVLCSVDVS